MTTFRTCLRIGEPSNKARRNSCRPAQQDTPGRAVEVTQKQEKAAATEDSVEGDQSFRRKADLGSGRKPVRRLSEAKEGWPGRVGRGAVVHCPPRHTEVPEREYVPVGLSEHKRYAVTRG